MTFAQNYVSYPVCCPSRATFFSGQYAHNHHVMGLYPPTGGYIRFDRWNSLPVWLEHAGYATAHIGKYINGYGTQVEADVPPGWTEWHGAIDGSTYRMWGYTLNDNGRPPHLRQPLRRGPAASTRPTSTGEGRRLHQAPRALRIGPSSSPSPSSPPTTRRSRYAGVTGQSVRPAPRDRDRARGTAARRPRAPSTRAT